MAVGQGYSKTATNGLVFAFDTGDTRNSFLGRPTTNLMEGYGLSNYNNVPGSVTTTLSQTSDSYRGTPIWIQTLTPLDGSGVSWLSNGNNPGLGVVSSGGGGLANRYTGHSIFYKSTVPMHSVPIFLAYSNIGGWQCNTCPPEDMGDGWFRAKVLWYDTTTRSDGKYWAINPLSATLNTPITIYWAGPFKEDLNSQYISQYTPTSRSNTQSLLALAGNTTLSVADVSFNSNLQTAFDGTNDYIQTALTGTYSQITYEFMGFFDDPTLNVFSRDESAFGDWTSSRIHFGTRWSVGMHWNVNGVWNQIPTTNLRYGWNHYCLVWDNVNNQKLVYINGILSDSNTTNGNITMGDFKIGVATNLNYYYKGNIDVFKVYTRAITAGEVKQNYGHYKTRFNLP